MYSMIEACSCKLPTKMESIIASITLPAFQFRRVESFRHQRTYRETPRHVISPPCRRFYPKQTISQLTHPERYTNPPWLQFSSSHIPDKRLSYSESSTGSPHRSTNACVQGGSHDSVTMYEKTRTIRKHSKPENIKIKTCKSKLIQRPSSVDSLKDGTRATNGMFHIGYSRQTSVPGELMARKQDMTSLNEHTANRKTSDSEVLEPFEVVSTFKRQPPSYWIGCIYKFIEAAGVLQVIVRQTGVLPEILQKGRFSRLSASVNYTGESCKHHVSLAKSRNDNSFRSTVLTFNVGDVENVKDNSLTVKLYHHNKLVCKKVIAEWTIPLTACTDTEKSEWKRYSA